MSILGKCKNKIVDSVIIQSPFPHIVIDNF